MKKFLKSITVTEWLIWTVSAVSITAGFFVFKNDKYHYLVGSLIGITSLILIAKGNPIGQALTIVFGVFYGIISYTFKYYGEMITYLGMSAPMAVFALITWLKNPYKGNKSEVKVNTLSRLEWCLFAAGAAAITVAFYFILGALETSNLIISTVSVLTSFMAAYLTARRSRFYAVFYAANDVVLIIMWVLASIESLTYLPMVICFAAFLVSDLYAFVNWTRIKKRQKSTEDNKMATSQDYIDFVCSQIEGFDLKYKKMFGEYMVYANDKPVLLVCDSTVFVKKLEPLSGLLADAECGIPYRGAKEHYILDIENTELTQKVVEILESITPVPVKRKR